MNIKILFFSMAIGFVISCNNQHLKPKENIPSAKTDSVNCYAYIKHLDTIRLKTIEENGLVTGTLVYNLYQKDKYMGTIQGQMRGELLIADFSFSSEGVKSVRQVAFKKSGKSFIEGYAETEDIKGKTTFKNIDSLNFKNLIVLWKVDCKN